MEHLPFALFALLPLGLFGLLERGRHRHSAGFAFLAALAPVIASGISSLINHGKQKAADKQAEEQKRLAAEQADTLKRQEWDTQQNSPAAQAARFKSKFAYGKLAGAMGGLDKVPQSLADYYKSGYATPEYTGTSSYVPTPKRGGGAWDFLGEAGKALSYLDIAGNKEGGGKGLDLSALRQSGNAAAQQGGMGALQGGGIATDLTGLLDRLKQQGGVAAQSGGLGALQGSPLAKNPF